MTILKDIRVFVKVPELRHQAFQLILAKVAGIFTMVVFSPFLALGFLSIALVHVFDYAGQICLWLPYTIANWLQEYQRNQIRESRTIMTLSEVQERTGAEKEK